MVQPQPPAGCGTDEHLARSVSLRALSLPMLFEGRLPDLNLGTHQGRSCMPKLESAITQALEASRGHYSAVVNGRFKGGYITRYYGEPSQGVHAVQLELSQRVYLRDERSPHWDATYAQSISDVILGLISTGINAL